MFPSGARARWDSGDQELLPRRLAWDCQAVSEAHSRGHMGVWPDGDLMPGRKLQRQSLYLRDV
jgi:hypothetical protein